jgi:CheY-like chemotaxis protein
MTDLLQRSLTPAIRLAVSFPDNLPSLKADPNQLELALLNLVLNARDAMPLGGTISISGRTHSPTTPSHLGLTGELYVEVSVQDTGTGMDTATIQRAVEPFFTTKGIGKGTGLGLSMVKGFAEQSGGTIEIESQPHHGTSVRLYLPATMDHVRPDVRIASVGAGSTRSLTVLVVDDDPLVLAGTSAMLEDLGHVAVEANSGERALELLSGAAVDVVITDQVMPGMTGLELISQIQVKWPYVGIIIATGYTDVALTELRNVRRLTKPYFQNDLAQLLSAVAGPAKSNVISFR